MTSRHTKRINGVLRSLTIASFIVGTIMLMVLVIVLARPAEFNPVTYETGSIARVAEDGAIIIPQVAEYEAPSVLASEGEAPVLMQRCSTYPETYDAVANTWFEHVETGERFYHSQDLPITVEPNCVRVRVSLELPTDLLAFVEFDANEPITVSEWLIAGTVQATRPGATDATWQTETFLLVNDHPPLPAQG